MHKVMEMKFSTQKDFIVGIIVVVVVVIEMHTLLIYLLLTFIQGSVSCIMLY